MLAPIVAKFPPDDSAVLKFAADPSQPHPIPFSQASQEIPGGEVAHVLMTWSSAPIHLTGMVMDDCTAHDTLTLSWDSPAREKPFAEIRHLWMQTCGSSWVSSYRLGPYVPGEAIDSKWLERFALQPSDFAPKNPREAKLAAAEGAKLWTLSDVEYLQGTFESGYSGYFELFLKLPSPASAGCPFRILRKREADGQTIIHLNACDNIGVRQPPEMRGRTRRLLIRELGLLPERPGRVEYDLVSEVSQNGRLALARLSTTLSIRDPKQPMLPVIDTRLPGCEASQLKLASPPVELGRHWNQARNYAPAGQEWQDAKVFEVTNTSAQGCMLGAVPELKFLNPPEVTNGGLLLEVCRNCSSALFQPRESRWIELQPNDSAHFIVQRTVLDADYSFKCTVIGGIDLSLPGGKQPIRLPFEAGSCGQVRVSAWRAGRYDDDPMNIRYEPAENQRIQQRIAGNESLPSECMTGVSTDTGTPVPFASGQGVIWALSTKPAAYGEPLPAILWICNTTDKPVPVMTCEGIEFFWQHGIDVFDSSGQRVASAIEENEKKNGHPHIFACTRNFPIFIQPHTSAHTTFSHPAFDFMRNLGSYYSLPPGRYFVVPSERGVDDEPLRRKLPEKGNALLVTVEQQ